MADERHGRFPLVLARCRGDGGEVLTGSLQKAGRPVGRWRPVRLFDRLADTHPQLRVRHAIDDRGYDVANNYQYLDLWRILSVILMRDTDKNGVYTLEGNSSE